MIVISNSYISGGNSNGNNNGSGRGSKIRTQQVLVAVEEKRAATVSCKGMFTHASARRVSYKITGTVA